VVSGPVEVLVPVVSGPLVMVGAPVLVGSGAVVEVEVSPSPVLVVGGAVVAGLSVLDALSVVVVVSPATGSLHATTALASSNARQRAGEIMKIHSTRASPAREDLGAAMCAPRADQNNV